MKRANLITVFFVSLFSMTLSLKIKAMEPYGDYSNIQMETFTFPLSRAQTVDPTNVATINELSSQLNTTLFEEHAIVQTEAERRLKILASNTGWKIAFKNGDTREATSILANMLTEPGSSKIILLKSSDSAESTSLIIQLIREINKKSTH